MAPRLKTEPKTPRRPKAKKQSIEERQILALKAALHLHIDTHMKEIARLSFLAGRRSGLDELSPLLFTRGKKRA